DPLGFYLGAGVGRSQVRTDVQFAAPTFGPLGFSEKATGWKLIVGIRPLSVIGAEAEYIDFGSASGATGIAPTATQGGINAAATRICCRSPSPGVSYRSGRRARATAAYAPPARTDARYCEWMVCSAR